MPLKHPPFPGGDQSPEKFGYPREEYATHLPFLPTNQEQPHSLNTPYQNDQMYPEPEKR